MRVLVILSCVATTSGCIDGLTQVAGTGAIYQTRCSADMVAVDGQYRASCTPEACTPGFQEGPVSHVVVALDPGTKVIGYAERVCLQDLSKASDRFGSEAMSAPDAQPSEP